MVAQEERKMPMGPVELKDPPKSGGPVSLEEQERARRLAERIEYERYLEQRRLEEQIKKEKQKKVIERELSEAQSSLNEKLEANWTWKDSVTSKYKADTKELEDDLIFKFGMRHFNIWSKVTSKLFKLDMNDVQLQYFDFTEISALASVVFVSIADLIILKLKKVFTFKVLLKDLNNLMRGPLFFEEFRSAFGGVSIFLNVLIYCDCILRWVLFLDNVYLVMKKSRLENGYYKTLASIDEKSKEEITQLRKKIDKLKERIASLK